MPSSVEEIKNYAFWGCQNLKRVYLGSNVEKIPDYAFENCTALEKAAFSYSLRRIGMKAFAGCSNLGNTEIPMSVSFIHDTAFDGCVKLALLAEAGSYGAEYEAKRDKSVPSSEEYQDILNMEETDTGNTGNGQGGTAEGSGGNSGEAGGASGGGSAGDVSGTLNGNLLGQSTVVGGNAVVFMDNNQSQVRSGTESGQGNNIQSGNIQSYPNSDTAAMEVIGGGGSSAYPKYTIVNNEIIASQAYYRNSQMENYRIPEGIKKIGEFAFARSGLASITIPEGVTTIGYGAFYHCDNLAEIEIPSSVTEIEPSAFAETKWLKERKSDRENPFVIVGDGILIAYGGMGSQIEIPGNVKQIGAEAFKGNTQITSISLPSSVTTIGEDAFAGCSSLPSISGG
ncbi:MAG: leucine-rich repeat domain-containing protein, partial [Kineothrix sp.]|nr:leucine-rich repeat domain-containing protein [Kineothrix sp.]